MYFDSPPEAAHDFRAYLDSALGCVIDQIHLKVPGRVYAGQAGDIFSPTLNDDTPSPLSVRYSDISGAAFDDNLEPSLFLVFTMNFRVPYEDQGYRVSIVDYVFSFRTHRNDGRYPEILAWHWHPESAAERNMDYPHLHVRNELGALAHNFNKRHIPTSRMTIEDVIEFLIRDTHVVARIDGWKRVLDSNRDVFRERRQRY